MQDGEQPNQPGFVFKPGDETAELPPVASTPSAVQRPVEQISQPDSTSEPTQPISELQTDPTPLTADNNGVTWTASEYMANPKNAGWFMALTVTSVVLAIIVYIVTRDIVSTIVTAIVGLTVGIFAARQPRTLQYRIDNKGLHIGEKFYPYESFKSFSIASEHAMNYISLQPLKRFMPPLTVHYDPADENQITQTLADYLPFEDHKPDMVENISRRVRF